MIIEVTGTSTQNKGAELMLQAIRDHFSCYPTVQLAVDQFFGSFAERAKYGLLQKVTLHSWGRSKIAFELMPKQFREAFGLVHDKEVDILLDAAGFAFGDQHPLDRAIHFAERVEQAKTAGKGVILLPQALGPFETPSIRDAFARIVAAADLVFARDDESFEYAREVTGRPQHLRQAPDFTNLVQPRLVEEDDDSTRVVIVPNQRMVEKASSEDEASEYVAFMCRCIDCAGEFGLEPVLLLHSQNDEKLANSIEGRLLREVPLHVESDPFELKRFLGESHLVIGSRFHALVGALSQGIPTIGTTWSHKYDKLFQDYACKEMLLPITASLDEIRSCIRACTGSKRAALQGRIALRGELMKEQTRAMWREVDNVCLPGHAAKSSVPERA